MKSQIAIIPDVKLNFVQFWILPFGPHINEYAQCECQGMFTSLFIFICITIYTFGMSANWKAVKAKTRNVSKINIRTDCCLAWWSTLISCFKHISINRYSQGLAKPTMCFHGINVLHYRKTVICSMSEPALASNKWFIHLSLKFMKWVEFFRFLRKNFGMYMMIDR